MVGLLNMLAMTENHEITCDDVSDVLAEFAELSQQGEDITEMMPLVEKHLHMCPDCIEEYEALMTVLESENETPE
jgi:predicted anti-sigma-YlaC factor YlaD